MIATTEKFLAKYLGGRFQEDVKPEVAARLKEITVDVKTVTLPKKVEATASAPKPARDLKAGTANYKAIDRIRRADDSALTTTTVIKEDGDNWIVTETADTPQGQLFDSTTSRKAL